MTGTELHEIAKVAWNEVKDKCGDAVLAGYSPYAAYWDALAAKVQHPATPIDGHDLYEHFVSLYQLERPALTMTPPIWGALSHHERGAWISLAKSISSQHEKIDALNKECEQLRVQLAGCLTAAEGHTSKPAEKGMYGWSPAYQAVLDVRRQLDDERTKMRGMQYRHRQPSSSVRSVPCPDRRSRMVCADVPTIVYRDVQAQLKREEELLEQASMNLQQEGYVSLKSAISKILEVVKSIVGPVKSK